MILGFALSGLLARAGSGFSLQIDPSLPLNDWERQRLTEFLSSVESKVPGPIRVSINRAITVKFVDFGEPTSIEVVLPSCKPESTERAQTLGRVRKPWFRSIEHAGEIEINRLLMTDILPGAEQSRTYPCGHGSAYRLAEATLVHELGHIYDATGGYSDDRRFIYLAGYAPGWLTGTPDNKNLRVDRSPDPYEQKNIREAFAVNLEFFALDPEFKCRRPSVYRYFEELLGRPEKNGLKDCQINPTVTAMDSSTGMPVQATLDPKRISGVDFLLANKGSDMSSRWGHAMFRLLVCREGREPGPDCRKDVGWQIVAGYRANISDIKTSYWKGIFGGYPSQLFLLTLPGVIEEYTRGERRDLLSWPITLSEQEKDDFIHRLLEQYWSYQGDYKFLTNNCATEARDFMKSVVRAPWVDELGAITPVGLAEEMFPDVYRAYREMGEMITFADSKKMDPVEIFPADQERVVRAFQEINRVAHLKDPDPRRFILESAYADRQALYQKLIQAQPAPDREHSLKLAGSFYILEDEIHHSLQARLTQEMSAMVLDLQEHPEKWAQWAAELKLDPEKTFRASQEVLKALLDPGTQLLSGYGIALNADRGENEGDATIRRLQREAVVEDAKRLVEVLKKRSGRTASELDASAGGLKFFAREILRLRGSA